MAIKLAKTQDLSREDWLALRRQGLGGSDAATLLGLNPYDSLLGLWADKKGLATEREDTLPIRLGRAFEDVVARMWADATGRKVARDNFMYQADGAPWMLANVDRRVVGQNAGLECKTTGRFEKSAFEDGTVVGCYAAQCQWYMMVCGFERMYLAVLDRVSGRFEHYTIEPDAAQQAALHEAGRRFWHENVLGDRPPEPDGSEACGQAVRALYPARADAGVVALSGLEGCLAEYVALGARKKEIEQRRDQCAQRVQLAMRGATRGVADGFKVSWSPQMRPSADYRRLRADHPDIYADYVSESSGRVFRVSGRGA